MQGQYILYLFLSLQVAIETPIMSEFLISRETSLSLIEACQRNKLGCLCHLLQQYSSAIAWQIWRNKAHYKRICGKFRFPSRIRRKMKSRIAPMIGQNSISTSFLVSSRFMIKMEIYLRI